jgi:hypothetical protein
LSQRQEWQGCKLAVLRPFLHCQRANESIARRKQGDNNKGKRIAVVAHGRQGAPEKEREKNEAHEHEYDQPALRIASGDENREREEHTTDTVEYVEAGD